MAAGPIYLYTFEPSSMEDLHLHSLDPVPAGQSTAQHSLFPLLISMTEYRQSAWAIGNNWRGTEYDVNYDSSLLTPPKRTYFLFLVLALKRQAGYFITGTYDLAR